MHLSHLASCLCLASASVAALPQVFHLEVISSPDLSAELFRTIYGSLKSWSQAFQPNGRCVNVQIARLAIV
jgi:hypothetical protein